MRLCASAGRGGGEDGAAGERGEDFFESLDANQDGDIDLEEFLGFFAAAERQLGSQGQGAKEEL